MSAILTDEKMSSMVDHEQRAANVRQRAEQSRTIQQHGQIHEAAVRATEAYEDGLRWLGDKHPATLKAQVILASTLLLRGLHEDAEAMAKLALATTSRELGESHADTFAATNALSHILADQLKLEDAHSLARTTLLKATQSLGPSHEETITATMRLGAVLRLQGRSKEAAKICEPAVQIAEQALGTNHASTVKLLLELAYDLANAKERKSEFADASAKALARTLDEYGADHLLTAMSKVTRHRYLVQQDDNAKAEGDKLIEEAYELVVRFQEPVCPQRLYITFCYINALVKFGNVTEATSLAVNALHSSRLQRTKLNAMEIVFMYRLALLLFRNPDAREKSLRVMDEVIMKGTEVYGAEHLFVKACKNSLKAIEGLQRRIDKPMRLFDNISKNGHLYEIMTQEKEPSQRTFEAALETNANRGKREVLLKIRPLPGLVEEFQWGRMADIAKLPSLAYWAIEVRPEHAPESYEGPTWETVPIVDTNMRLEMTFGKWKTPSQQVPWKKPYTIKTYKARVGTTKLRDTEIDQIAMDAFQTSILEQLTTEDKTTLAAVNKLFVLLNPIPQEHEKAMEYVSEASTASEDSEAVHIFNAAFEKCQDFATQITTKLCPDGILKKDRGRKALERLMTARKTAYTFLDTGSNSDPVSLRVLRDQAGLDDPPPAYEEKPAHASKTGAHDEHESVNEKGWFVSTV